MLPLVVRLKPPPASTSIVGVVPEEYGKDPADFVTNVLRVEANKTKQEAEFNKARDTIKYLRDENLELNTKLDQQVSELEDKIREYRLRFEYAQKQLNTK